jgi:hypothetical protein
MATKKMGSKPELGQDIEPGLIVFRANVTNGGMDGKVTPRMDGTPTDDEMMLINKFSRRGNLDPALLYAFDCTPSTQEIDSYFTYMDTSSLINYATESKLGIPFMNSHRTGGRGMSAELPIGRSFTGMVENDPDKAGQQIFGSSAYMLRNNRANGSVNTDDLIAAMEAGINSDISIQFNFSPGTPEKNFEDRTWLRCSICGNDFLRSNPWDDGPDDCPHWPGEVYKSDGGKRQDLCKLGVINGHLTEYSSVYAGATPGAIINKARLAVSEGFFNRSMVNHLEGVYQTRLMDYATFQVPIIQVRKEKTEGGVTLTPGEIEVTETLVNTERTKDEMANKRELEDASKEGAKLALANLAKSVMGSRDFSEGELALFPEIETRLAAGELDQANLLLARFIGSQGQELEEGEMDENGNIRLAGFVEDVAGESEEGKQDAATTSIISLSLSANERQQFQVLKDENIVLKRENKRLAPLAETGERYRSVLIEQTIRQAVRAEMGSESDTLDMLQHLPIEHIERIYSQYKQLGDNRLGQHDQDESGNLILTGQGGRQTVASNPNQPNFGQALSVAAQRAGLGAKRNDLKAYH